MKYSIGLLLVGFSLCLRAQVITGKVYDEVNNEPLPGATVKLLNSEQGAITDGAGVFVIEGIDPGRYSLKVSFVGYRPVIHNDLWVKTGKETVLDFGLEVQSQDLEEITITHKQTFAPPGKILITEEQINRFAATYYDPARLLTTSPDVAVTNDQNNLLSVRGLPPSYNAWLLEGGEIVNPNHLSNAGTFLDQPTPTGGGVNILSAQMLDQSAFLYSTFSNTFGNSVGGIFDMQMKSGNSQDRHYTAQASLIGIDLYTEGPYKIGGKSTYAANYRYSFTGLLTGMGVDFGGESIGFQDLSFATELQLSENSKLKVFGMGGLSFNHFDHSDFEDSEREKDRNDIDYDNKMGVAGATLTNTFKNSRLVTTLIASGYDNVRDQFTYNNQDAANSRYLYEDQYSIYSANSRWSKRFNKLNFVLGTMANYYSYVMEEGYYFNLNSDIPTTGNSIEKRQLLMRHYLEMDWSLASQILLNYGITANWNNNQQYSFDPRVKLSFLVSENSTVSLGAGKYSQLYQPFNVFFLGPDNNSLSISNEEDFIKSYRYSISYDYSNDQFNIGAEFFHYYFPEVYMSFETESAKTTGLSLMVDRSFSSGFYLKGGGSFFNAPVTGNIENRYNTKYNLSLASGKEWQKSTEKKSNAFSVNGRVMYQGGQNIQQFIWWQPEGYRTNDYFRFDLRIQWVRYRDKFTRVLAIDLQNTLNTQNEAYQYFDSFTGEIETQYQLGLIPILTYRVEW